jgi:hypothetical protein
LRRGRRTGCRVLGESCEGFEEGVYLGFFCLEAAEEGNLSQG